MKPYGEVVLGVFVLVVVVVVEGTGERKERGCCVRWEMGWWRLKEYINVDGANSKSILFFSRKVHKKSK